MCIHYYVVLSIVISILVLSARLGFGVSSGEVSDFSCAAALPIAT